MWSMIKRILEYQQLTVPEKSSGPFGPVWEQRTTEDQHHGAGSQLRALATMDYKDLLGDRRNEASSWYVKVILCSLCEFV